jgi:hypothetical protein
MSLSARFDVGGAGVDGVRGAPAGAACGRCHASESVAVLRGEALCAHCIVAFVTRRGRAALMGVPQLGHAVALALGGGACSSTAVDLAQGIMDCGRKRRWWADAIAVHVDVSSLSLLGEEGALAAHTRAVTCHALSAGLLTFVVPLECATEGAPLVAVRITPPRPPLPVEGGREGLKDPLLRSPLHEAAAVEPCADEALHALRAARADALAPHVSALLALFGNGSGPPSASADVRQHVLDGCIGRLAAEVAAALHVPHLLLAVSVTSLAERVMTATGSGAGASVPADSCTIDRRWTSGTGRSRPLHGIAADGALTVADGGRVDGGWYPAEGQTVPPGLSPASCAQPSPGGVLRLRPLLELERRECELYCEHRGVPVSLPPTFTALAGPKGSSAAVNAGVLAGLQATYPSTVHNVVRTARKLALPWSEEAAGGKDPRLTALRLCELCASVLSPSAAASACTICTRLRRAAAVTPSS